MRTCRAILVFSPHFEILYILSTCLAFIPQGILLVYDITNGWSFDGIDRWIREIDEVIPFNTCVVDKEIQDMHGRISCVCILQSLRRTIVLSVIAAKKESCRIAFRNPV